MSTTGKQLPTRDIITVNMDGGVGGSWTVHSSEPKLKENQQEPLEQSMSKIDFERYEKVCRCRYF